MVVAFDYIMTNVTVPLFPGIAVANMGDCVPVSTYRPWQQHLKLLVCLQLAAGDIHRNDLSFCTLT